ncbi:MAG: TRAP transporter large permease [Candidatus Rokubacteria bacterium]|nr:TRAP transporter large permease [Candidatus Rokubacteria bacterium]MBI2494218.1 TRAP transporter large permease [Candidatus Rokubacteria bacterium]
MSTALGGFLGVFVALLLFGMPVAWSMATATVVYVALSGQWTLLPILPEKIFQGMDVFILVAIPLFLLAGEIISEGGIAGRLVDFANVLVGWMRGGLAQVAIGASVFFAGITGVALGEIAALGRIFIPAMVRDGYPPALAAAVIASASIIGPTIPPSLPIIIYGSVTNTSVGGLMLAAVAPGVLLGVAQMTLVAILARRIRVPPVATDRSPRAIARAGLRAVLPIGMPVLILGTIVGGVMTPTEAAGASVVYALVVGYGIYRSLRVTQLWPLLARTALFSGQLIIIVGCGAAFAWVMGFENVTGRFAATVADWGFGPTGTLILANLLFLLLGMFIDPSASIILFAPILAPAAEAVGIHPLHFGVVAIVNLNIGLLTPPLGVSLFAAERIAGCGLTPLIRAVLPFIVVNAAALVVISMVPTLSLALPRLAGF